MDDLMSISSAKKSIPILLFPKKPGPEDFWKQACLSNKHHQNYQDVKPIIAQN